MPLTKKYPLFSFDSFEIDRGGRIVFHYSATAEDGSQELFSPEIGIDFSALKGVAESEAAGRLDALRPAAFALGMAELPSFYKAFCSPKISVKAGPLSPEQIAFWTKLYESGLGEFFYKNKIDFRGLIKIVPEYVGPDFPALVTGNDIPNGPAAALTYENFPAYDPEHSKVLLPIGGGKDSIVSAELLKAKGIDFTWYALEPNIATMRVIEASGNKKAIFMQRDIAKNFARIIELNAAGAYNGHIPISAVYAMSAALVAGLHGFTHIALSNERSANVGNAVFHGMEINHQYSKSFEFERACNEYIRVHVSPGIWYFSLLRPLHSIQIVREFAKHPKYFPVFLSCNPGLKSGKWCGKCAKCVSAFVELSAFLPPETVARIFGNGGAGRDGVFKSDGLNVNLFECQELLPLFGQLVGMEGLKPFDCVGTAEESLLALSLAREQYLKAGFAPEKLPFILLKLDSSKGKTCMPILNETTTEHLIPAGFPIENMLEQSFPKIAIAGYGMEGQALSYHFAYPGQTVIVLEKEDANGEFVIPADIDVVYKSPGIPLRKVRCLSPHTRVSALTDLFVQKVGKRVIGVTGTKGKSTTAALIHHLLSSVRKPLGKETHFVGNIGRTPLELLASDTPDTLYVYEMSSYQCELLSVSPHVAVITNLYPEHLDHHGSLEKYWAAKMRIARFQGAEDVLVMSPGIEPALAGIGASLDREGSGFAGKGKRIVVGEPRPEECVPTKLAGKHNQHDIALAMAAARAALESLGEGPLSDAAARASIATFEPLPHRLEKVFEARGISFYDDTLATIPEATLASIRALEELGGVNTIILGGQDRGLDFSQFARELAGTKIKNFIIFPETGERMVVEIAKDPARAKNIFRAASMEEAVRFVYQAAAEPGKPSICLLSTASPSYNMFKNFEDKSIQYLDWAKKIGDYPHPRP